MGRGKKLQDMAKRKRKIAATLLASKKSPGRKKDGEGLIGGDFFNALATQKEKGKKK